MNLKKLPGIALIFLMLGCYVPSFAAPSPISGDPIETVKPTAAQLMIRLHEIKDLAKTDLSPSQKNDLRNEVKDIRKQLKDSKKGIYLSVGAIIIILLILILLLR